MRLRTITNCFGAVLIASATVVAGTPAFAEDAPAPAQTPEAAKAELIADLKAIVTHGNLQDEKFIADLFKVEMTPVLFACIKDCTSIEFKHPSLFYYDFDYFFTISYFD